MAASQKSAGLGHNFLALRHAEACPGPEHHRTLDSHTTRQKMLRYQSEGQESPLHPGLASLLASGGCSREHTKRALSLHKNRPRSAKPQLTRWRNSLTARPKPVIKNGSKVTGPFIRTGARESSSWPGVRSTSRPDTFLQTTSDNLEFLLDTKRRTIHFYMTRQNGQRGVERAHAGIELLRADGPCDRCGNGMESPV
jgi:hypothetical protein